MLHFAVGWPSRRAGRCGRWSACLAALVALLVLVGAGCERRSQDAPAAGAPAARVLVTAEYGARPLLDVRVEPGRSVMRSLRGATEVGTRYSGGFVSEMFGLRSDLDARRDWFLFVNGLLSPVGAKDVTLEAGDETWWDFRDWGTLSDPWAVVGQWPHPFTRPAPAVSADAPLAEALRRSGAVLDDDCDAPWRVRVGASDAIAAADPAWRRALDDPTGVGLTASVDGDVIVAMDADADERRVIPGARALIAAVPTGSFPEDGVLLVVAGLDEAAAEAAAERLAREPEIVRGAYALVLDGTGTPMGAAGRDLP